jgi:hypothetical protein
MFPTQTENKIACYRANYTSGFRIDTKEFVSGIRNKPGRYSGQTSTCHQI